MWTIWGEGRGSTPVGDFLCSGDQWKLPPVAVPLGDRWAKDGYIATALQEVMPSFSSHSTLAPTFQPSPFTLCSLPSSVFTVAIPLSSSATTFPFIVPPAKAGVVPKTKRAQVRAKDFPSFRIIYYPPHSRDSLLTSHEIWDTHSQYTAPQNLAKRVDRNSLKWSIYV